MGFSPILQNETSKSKIMKLFILFLFITRKCNEHVKVKLKFSFLFDASQISLVFKSQPLTDSVIQKSFFTIKYHKTSWGQTEMEDFPLLFVMILTSSR